jgi:DNA-binding NarL/FixJ family response regulator
MRQNVSRNITFKPEAGINSIPACEGMRVPAEGTKAIQDSSNRLTRREQEVLALIAEGCSTKRDCGPARN